MDNAQPEKAEGNLLVVDDDLHFQQTLNVRETSPCRWGFCPGYQEAHHMMP